MSSNNLLWEIHIDSLSGLFTLTFNRNAIFRDIDIGFKPLSTPRIGYSARTRIQTSIASIDQLEMNFILNEPPSSTPTISPTSYPSISIAPTKEYNDLSCPHFEITFPTYSASINTTNCEFYACPNYELKISSCSERDTCDGDTFLRLVDSTGKELYLNDDACGLCSEIIYSKIETCGFYTVKQGCYSSSSCSGNVVISFKILPFPILSIALIYPNMTEVPILNYLYDLSINKLRAVSATLPKDILALEPYIPENNKIMVVVRSVEYNHDTSRIVYGHWSVQLNINMARLSSWIIDAADEKAIGFILIHNTNISNFVSINRLKYSSTIFNGFDIDTIISDDQKHFIPNFSTNPYRLLSYQP